MAVGKKPGQFWAKLVSAVKGQTPPGQTADSWAEDEYRPLGVKGPGTAASLTVDKAKELIFGRLCKEYQARGAGAWLEREVLRKELGIPEDIFRWALTAMTSGEGSLFVDRDYTGNRIFLGRRGLVPCKDGINPFATGQPAKK